MRDWYAVSFTQEDPELVNGVKVHSARAVIPGAGFIPTIGVDPGRRMGIALCRDDEILALWGELDKKDPQWLVGLQAFDWFFHALPTTVWWSKFKPATGVVEGAIYKPKGAQGAAYGEANLAYIRFGMLLGLRGNGVGVELSPPMSIRKRAFGDGKQKARDFWPNMNLNATDAIGCALAGQEVT